MTVLQDVVAAAQQQQGIIRAAIAQTLMLLDEVKQLIRMNDPAGAVTLLETILQRNNLLIASAQAQADLTTKVDAVNGDPAWLVKPGSGSGV